MKGGALRTRLRIRAGGAGRRASLGGRAGCARRKDPGSVADEGAHGADERGRRLRRRRHTARPSDRRRDASDNVRRLPWACNLNPNEDGSEPRRSTGARAADHLPRSEAGADQRAIRVHRGPRLGPEMQVLYFSDINGNDDLPADVAGHDHDLPHSEPERQRPGPGSARAADRRRLQGESRRARRRNDARRDRDDATS